MQGGALRPRRGTRRLRRRHGGHDEPSAGAARHRQGHRGAEEPGPPRRGGRRGEHRRRRGHPDGHARRVHAGRGRRAAAGTGPLRGGHRVPGPGHRRMRPPAASHRHHRARGGAGTARLAYRTHRSERAGIAGAGLDARIRHVGCRLPGRLPGRAGFGTQGVPHPQARGARGGRVLRLAVRPDHHLQGHADHHAADRVLPGPQRRADGGARGHRALAFLHQHVPQLAAGPALPPAGPQRRDQHHPRQPQLAAGPRGTSELRTARRVRAAAADRHARLFGLRHLRRVSGAAAPGRPQPAARHSDDAAARLGERRHARPRRARLLRVQQHADRTVGRSGAHHLHRRHAGRRAARPQRLPPGPLAAGRHRSGRARLRSRRAARRGRRTRERQRASGTGADVPCGHRRRPHRARRRDQARARRAAPVPAVGGGQQRAHERTARPGTRQPLLRIGAPPPARLRLHRGGHQADPQPHGGHRQGAARLDGQRYADGRALRPQPHAVRLLHAEVRAGHQPAARLGARTDRHLSGIGDRPRAEPAGGHRTARQEDPDPAAGHQLRGDGAAQAARPRRHPRRLLPAVRRQGPVPGRRRRPRARIAARRDLRRHRPGDAQAARPRRHPRRLLPAVRRQGPVPGRRRRPRARIAARRDLRRHRPGDCRRRELHRALRPRLGSHVGADPVAAAHLRGPASPAAPAHAHPGLAGRGSRRCCSPPRSSITCCAGTRAPRSRWPWRPATCERSTTSRCSSPTAPHA